VRCTHQGATPGLYPQLYAVGVPSNATGETWEGGHKTRGPRARRPARHFI